MGSASRVVFIQPRLQDRLLATPSSPAARGGLARTVLLVSAAAVFAAVAGAVDAAPPPAVTLRNNLVPGQTTQHKIAVTIRRTGLRDRVSETLVYSRRSDWVRCNVDESKPGQVKIYQMIADAPVAVLKFYEDGKPVTPTPTASRFSLVDGSTALYDGVITPTDGPCLAPHAGPAEQTVLRALLDITHWPAKRVEPGGRWERDLREDGFQGTQTFTYRDLVEVDGRKLARIDLVIEGQFSGALAAEHRFIRTEAVIHWSRLDCILYKLDGQSRFERTRDGTTEEYDLKTRVTLHRERQLNDDEQEENTRHLNAFAEALTDFRAGQKNKAAAACRRFMSLRADSLWSPAFVELERRATLRPARPKRLTDAELQEALAKCVVAWEAAQSKRDGDLLDRTRKALEQMAADYGSNLRKAAADPADAVRSMAVFALAFGQRPADAGLVVRALSDESARVRGMALAGLAARRTAPADAEALLAALGDREPTVRSRACQAVAACIPPEHARIVAFVDKLHELARDDENRGVKMAAARALGEVGAPVDAPRLEKTLGYEADMGVRKAIQEAIKKLNAK